VIRGKRIFKPLFVGPVVDSHGRLPLAAMAQQRGDLRVDVFGS